MSDFTTRFTEQWYPLLDENSDSVGVGTRDSAYVSLANYHRSVLIANIGEIPGASTVNISIRQATSVAGAGVKVIAGKSITQLTTADDNVLVAICLRNEELDVTARFSWVSVRVVVAGAAVEMGWIFLGGVSRFQATPTANWQEIIP